MLQAAVSALKGAGASGSRPGLPWTGSSRAQRGLQEVTAGRVPGAVPLDLAASWMWLCLGLIQAP